MVLLPSAGRPPSSVKIKDIIIEILIIVFAVTLSIWLEGWSKHRRQQKEVQEFLLDLKDDLNNDIENMNIQTNKLSEDIKKNTCLKFLTKSRVDSFELTKSQFGISMSYIYRKTSEGNYEGFKSSGKIGFIENKKLKKLILEYFQESMPLLGESEKKFNSQVDRLADLLSQNGDKMEWFLHPSFKTNVDFFIQDAESNINAYRAFTKQAMQIIEEIDQQTKK